MAIELEGLEFQLEAKSSKAAEEVMNLATAFELLKTSTKGGFASVTSVSKSITSIGEALSKINTGQLRNLNEFLSGLRQLDGIRIPATITNGLNRLTDSLGRIRKQDIARLRDLTSALKELGEVSDVKVPSLRNLPRSNTDTQTDQSQGATPPELTQNAAETARATEENRSFWRSLHDIASSAMTYNRAVGEANQQTRNLGRAARSSSRGLRDLLQSMGSGLAAKVKESTAGIGKLFSSIKRIAMYRMLRAFFSQLTNAMKEGIVNLYKYSSVMGTEFKGSMDRLASSFLYLKNSMGALASPIINAVAPAIEYLIDRFVALVNIINQFFATLAGAGSFTAAKKVATNFKDAAGSASGAAKELKKSILAFDEINALARDNNGGGGGGASSKDYSSMFEELPIDGAVSDFAKRLKEAFEKGDWETLGRTIGGKLNEVIDEIDFDGIGTKIGYYLNGAIKTSYFALDETNFVGLGSKIASMFNHALGEIDSEYIGRLLVKKLTSKIDLVGGFLAELDFNQLGKTIGNTIKGVFSEASSWIANIDWKSVGSTFYTKLKGVLVGLDFPGIADAFYTLLGNAIVASVKGMLGFVQTAWRDIVTLFKDAANGDPLAQQIGSDLLNNILNGMLNPLGGLKQKLYETVIVPFIEAIRDAFGQGWADFVDGIFSSWKPVVIGSPTVDSSGTGGVNPLGKGGAGSQAKPYDIYANVSLIRKGWETLPKFVGDLDPYKVNLEKGNFTTANDFVGEVKPKGISLYKSGFETVDKFVGDVKPKSVTLTKANFTTVDDFVGVLKNKAVNLSKGNYTSLDNFVGVLPVRFVNLKKGNYTSIGDFVGTTVTVAVSLIKKGWSSIMSFFGLSGGGIIENGKLNRLMAGGGIMDALGRISKIPMYAGGTEKAHGTMFVAGERGAEIVGNINGHTEVLNRSQLASTMFAAITSGMRVMGSYLTANTNTLAACTNSILTMMADTRNATLAMVQTYDPRQVARLSGQGISSLDSTDVVSLTEGVRSGMMDATGRQIELLREQNDLLRQLLSKDSNVVLTTDSVVGAVQRKNQRDGMDIIPVGA